MLAFNSTVPPLPPPGNRTMSNVTASSSAGNRTRRMSGRTGVSTTPSFCAGW